MSACVFQSTHPVWDATVQVMNQFQSRMFQSTHPVWDATRRRRCRGSRNTFQSTHPVWDATFDLAGDGNAFTVSIHAPRVGCDGRRLTIPWRPRRFNPRTPCGMRPCIFLISPSPEKFQSTHPVWDATRALMDMVESLNVSIHAPRVGCDEFAPYDGDQRRVSIHAPRVGCDGLEVNS